MRKIKVGFLGCGNIGGGVWSLLEDMRADFARCFHISFEVKKMLVRALNEKRAVDVPVDRLTTDVREILNDPEISLVCEFMGGDEPAAQFMLQALKAGKHVITANKMALSLHWRELHAAAEEHRVGLYYEAAVCGAIPVIRTIKESMTGSRIDKIGGIVNGTTNYILSKMTENNLAYADALSQAQKLGLAEPDPTSDVEGHDAAYKLCILSALCFGKYVHPLQIRRQGISKVDIIDIKLGLQLELTLKLLARAQNDNGYINSSVSPVFVTKDNQLSHVSDAFNGVLLHGHACDDIFLYGRGAGSWPTASAIVGDMIQAAQFGADMLPHAVFENISAETTDSNRYYIRLINGSADVVKKIGDLIGKEQITLHTLELDGKSHCVLLTKELSEAQYNSLRNEIEKLTGAQPVCWPLEGSV